MTGGPNGGHQDKRGNRFQESLAVTERNVEILEILLGQVGQDIEVQLVRGEKGRILPETKLLQPLIDSAGQNRAPPQPTR